MIIDVFLQNIEEEVTCMDYNEEENLLAFAGSLGVGYLYKLGHKREVEVVDIEMLQENTDQVLVKLHGHFKKIT